MDLATQPELYTPSIDSNGNYVDSSLTTGQMQSGIRCPCGSRKDKVYDSVRKFNDHLRDCKTHQKWIRSMNLNKSNYFAENEILKTTVQTQKMIISQLERDLQTKNVTIDVLSGQIYGRTRTEDLLTYD